MANLLNRNNKHLFLEEPDESNNSFIANINSLSKSFGGLTSEDVLALKDIPATIVSTGEEWKLILEETALDLLAGATAFNTAIVTKITEDVPANSEITLPSIAKYIVGTNMLMLSYNGTVCYLGEQFEEIGESNTNSNKIKILFDLRTDDILEFRIVALNTNIDISPVIAEGSTESRTLTERFGDIINVKDFGAKGDNITDNTEAIQIAASKAIEKNTRLFFPYGTYKLTSAASIFWAHLAVGDGVVDRDGEKFTVGCPSGKTCNLYASPTGGGDGLSDNSPATFDECMQAAIAMSPFGGNLIINMLAGDYIINKTYTGINGIGSNISFTIRGQNIRKGVTTIGSIESGSNVLVVEDKTNYEVGDTIGIAGAGVAGKALLATITSISETTETTRTTFTISENSVGTVNNLTVWHDIHYPVKIRTDKTFVYSDVFAFYTCNNINIENVEIIQSDSTPESKCIACGYGVNHLKINNCRLHNNGWTAVLMQRGNRLIVSDSLIEGSGSGIAITAYGVMLTTNASGTRNVFYNLNTGIVSQGPAYAHNDYNDYVDCAYGTLCEYNANSENIDCRYSNVKIRARARSGSSFSTRKSSDWPSTSIQIYRGTFMDFTDRFPSAAGGVLLPFAGSLGRCSEFYKNGDLPLFARKEINLGNDVLPAGIRSAIANDSTILLSNDIGHSTITSVTPNGSHTKINHYVYDGENLSTGSSVTLDQYGVQLRYFDGTDFKLVMHSRENDVVPGSDNSKTLGTASYRWSQVYAASDSINTSDIREKRQIEPYPNEVLDAWSEVELRQFLFNDAVEKKGDSARIHAGLIAQQIIEAFKKHNLDATKYGLLCYDEWEDEYEDIEVIDKDAEYDSEGNEISLKQSHIEKKLVIPAGNRYGIRYSEALCLEAAYQRRENEKLKNELSNLQARLNTIESKLGIK